MSTFKTNVTVVGSVTATTVNGIIGLSSNDGDLLANGTADSGTSSYAARVDHVHPGTGGGATTLDGLTDVDTAGVTNGQALIYDSTSTSWKPGTVSSGSSNGDALEVLLNTTGNGGTTYTLSKAVSKVLVAVDGIIQTDYTQPNNTTSLVMGFNVDTTETITAWSFTAGAGGASNLDGLTDVVASAPINNDTLVYNSDTTSQVLESSLRKIELLGNQIFQISDATGDENITIPSGCDYILCCFAGYASGNDTNFNEINNIISIGSGATIQYFNYITRNSYDGECDDFIIMELVGTQATGGDILNHRLGNATGFITLLYFKNVYSVLPRVSYGTASSPSDSPIIINNLGVASSGDMLIGFVISDNAATVTHNNQTLINSASAGGGFVSIIKKQAASDFTATFAGGGNYASTWAIVLRNTTKILSATGSAEIDFGSYPGKNETDTTITGLSGISDISKATAQIKADSTTTDHTANDHKYAGLLIKLICSTPSVDDGFIIYGLSEHKMQGRFKIQQAYTS